MRPALQRQAKKITDLQKRLVPVRTGALRSAIGYSFGRAPVMSSNASFSSGGQGKLGGDPDLTVWIYAGTEARDKDGWYARFVEFGTAPHGAHPGTSPQPFFFPAIRLLRKDVKRNIARVFNRSLKNAGLRANKPRGRHVSNPKPRVATVDASAIFD
jgi:HK97 gp10 family phage protein